MSITIRVPCMKDGFFFRKKIFKHQMSLFTSSILSTNLSMAPANLSAARHASPATSLAVSRELPSSPPSSSWPAAGGGAKDKAEIRKMSRNVAAEPMISFRARESGLGNVSCHPVSLCRSPPQGESNNSTPKLFFTLSHTHSHAFVRVPSDLSRHNPNLPGKNTALTLLPLIPPD